MGIVAIIMGAIGAIIAALPFASPYLAFITGAAWLFIVLAIVFGIIAMVKKKTVPGAIGLALAVIAVVLYFVSPSAQDAVDQAGADFGAALSDPALMQQAMDPAAQQQLQQAMQGLGQAMQQLPAQPTPPPAQ